jgi:hypothetical protein
MIIKWCRKTLAFLGRERLGWCTKNIVFENSKINYNYKSVEDKPYSLFLENLSRHVYDGKYLTS